MSENWTVARVMEWSGDYLKKAGIPEPAHEVQIMMSEILGTSRMGVYLNHTKILEKKELERFRGFLLKRKEGYPLQYILGKAYFYGREFVVREGCFIPQWLIRQSGRYSPGMERSVSLKWGAEAELSA